MAKIKLSVKQTEAIEYLEDKSTREILYGGGAGGGKSFLLAYWHIKQRLRYPETRGLVGRESLKSLKESTLITMLKVCNQIGLQSEIHYKYNDNKSVIDWYNGSRTIFKDLAYLPSDPDFSRLGSTEFTDAAIDEANEVSEKGFSIVQSRLRWKISDYNLTPKILLTCNPGYHWIRDRYIRDDDDNPKILKPHQQFVPALVDDNPDPAFRAVYRENLELSGLSEYDMMRLLHGDWDAQERTGAEAYKEFDNTRHIADLSNKYDTSKPLHLSFDFNTAPHMTLIIMQVEGKDVFQIDEVCMTPQSKKNNTIGACREFVNRYRNHAGGVIVYGDPAGRSEDTRSQEGQNDFSIIMRELRDLKPQMRMLTKAPSVSMRLRFINQILKSNYAGISYQVDRRCKKTIADFVNVKEAPDGGKLKKRITDPVLGISYEQWGHNTDAADYFFTKCFHADYMKFSKPGSTSVVVPQRQRGSSHRY